MRTESSHSLWWAAEISTPSVEEVSKQQDEATANQVSNFSKHLTSGSVKLRLDQSFDDHEVRSASDAFEFVTTGSVSRNAYQEFLESVHEVAGLEMTLLCAIGSLGVNSKALLQPYVIEKIREIKPPQASRDEFLLRRFVRDIIPQKRLVQASYLHLSRTAFWVSPPSQSSEDETQCLGFVEYDRRMFRVTYPDEEPWAWPQLFDFPSVPGATVTLVEQSKKEREYWQESTFVAFGSYSHIRRLDVCNDQFPIVKLARHDPLAQHMIRQEYENYQRFASENIHIGAISGEPLKNELEIFGFRMKELRRIPRNELAIHLPSIKKAVAEFHTAGIAHGDLSPSNCMRDDEGRVILIDLSHARYLGEPLSKYHNGRRKSEPGAVIDQSHDIESLSFIKREAKRYI
ncbi:MAG: hypothetical protein M1833_004278 [Piccolia ochrophora]|nr:MAG: hypothetical protein M1833_004278 [Piccolia ochrophora]